MTNFVDTLSVLMKFIMIIGFEIVRARHKNTNWISSRREVIIEQITLYLSSCLC